MNLHVNFVSDVDFGFMSRAIVYGTLVLFSVRACLLVCVQVVCLVVICWLKPVNWDDFNIKAFIISNFYRSSVGFDFYHFKQCQRF